VCNFDKKKSEILFLKTDEKNLTKKIRTTSPSEHEGKKLCKSVDRIRTHAQFCGTTALLVNGRGRCRDDFEPSSHAKFLPNREMNRLLWCGLALSLFFALPSARALDEIPPPFGFKWNDLTGRVETLLKGAKARIVTREKKEHNEVWTVEGLVQPGLQRTLFTFREGFLVAIELQYEYPDWTIERYNERMGEIRRYFDAKFGTGKLVSRSRDTDTDVIQTLVGYQWTVGSTMLELFYFSAQRDALLFRTITVDYKMI
jgi:hypothetical protein